MKKESGSILAVSLWVLIALSIVAAAGAREVSTALEVSRRRQEGLEALGLARSAVNRAVIAIENDLPLVSDGDGVSWAATPLGTKINLNEASEKLLTALFEISGAVPGTAGELAADVLFWRGSRQPDEALLTYYENTLGYAPKTETLSVPEELILVRGFQNLDKDIRERVLSLSTTEETGKMHVNAASADVLHMLARSVASGEADPRGFADGIVEARSRGVIFLPEELNVEAFRSKLGWGDASEDVRTKILEDLLASGSLTAVSDRFEIRVSATRSGTTKNLRADYDRNENKLRLH